METYPAPPDPHEPDPQIELAKERNRLAADRTLLTWIRATVFFISIGLGLDQLFNAFPTHGSPIFPSLTSYTISLFFTSMGVLTIALAVCEYLRELRRFRQAVYVYIPRWSMGVMIACILVGFSLVAFVSLLQVRIPLPLL